MNKSILTTMLVVASLALAPATGVAKGPGLNKAMADVRAVTAEFHDLAVANAAGWSVRASDCVAMPGVGGMGYHYVNPSLLTDGLVDEQLPEVLVYAPTDDGGLRLVAVEWLAPRHIHPTPPSLFGETFHLNPHVGGPLGSWILHAWVWHPNPAGMFADFNPRISCPAP